MSFLKNMKILIIETSSIACSLALLIDNEISAIHEIMPMQQAQQVLPLLKKLLASKNIKLNQLDAVAFGCGPGSFTGIRIAASVAQGLGYACELPIISISSLAGLAQAAYEAFHWEQLLVAIDARIQEVYWGQYTVNSAGLVTLIGQEKVSKPEEVTVAEPSHWYGVGNAWEVYAKQIPYAALAIDAIQLATASAMALLAKDKYLKKEFLDPANALPVYLRDNVAKKAY